ncbi:hypothetical protein H4582DRAFT_367527 [Lactarius indigo]|nr:hypothetical protein H4582DRAFT_367527 [Lactarius indigo]
MRIRRFVQGLLFPYSRLIGLILPSMFTISHCLVTLPSFAVSLPLMVGYPRSRPGVWETSLSAPASEGQKKPFFIDPIVIFILG